MKFKWLKITTGDMIWGTNELKASDLVSLKNHGYEAILNLENMTYFDAEANVWKDIDGDA